MDAPAKGARETRVERSSDREIRVTRFFDAPPHLVFEAWTRPELFKRWWAPKSLGMPIRDCQMDVRTGGSYRLDFGQDEGQVWSFFGRYLDVVPNEKIVWTNDEGEQGAVTTVTFTEKDGGTELVYVDLYPSKAALEAEQGAEEGLNEQFGQLDALLAERAA